MDFGVGRGPAPIEHFWFGSDWPTAADRFEDVLGIICRSLRTGEITSEGSKFYDFRVTNVLDAYEGDTRIFSKACTDVVPRDLI